MSQNLEKVREIVGVTLSRASTISAEEWQMALMETDFIAIKEKMNKINQRLDGLYQNWQVEYKEAITPEQCEEIQQFYEPYVVKYETKYKILYKVLKQASREWTKVLPPKEPSLGMTPSLAVLDDASALKQKEWNRGEPSEEMLYSSIGRHLTPTAPVYDDVRTDLTLDMTPEGSLRDLPAAVEGIEERETTQQIFDEERSLPSNVVPPAAEIPETNLKVITESSNQVELSRRVEITREVSREDAIAVTRYFFTMVDEQRNTAELPVITTTDASQVDVPTVPHVLIETEPTEPGTRSPWTYLPNGSPPRPTPTATCTSQTWVQCVSEGQIEEPTREDGDSSRSDPSEPYVLAEGIPDELGQEWRILHPFEIPGVRFPTDDTPPNQRRLAENNALVELIQTTEYLEDAPPWGQRRFYPPRYGDPFYRECGRGHGRGRGRRNWLSEEPPERESGRGFGRGIFHGNGRGREIHRMTSENDQRDRQDENWSIPTNMEGRNDMRQEPQGIPPAPSPSEGRFTDWSSLGSPLARTLPHDIPNGGIEQSANQPDQQTTQSGSAPTREEVARDHSQEEVIITPRICQQPDEQSAQMIDMGTNTLNIEARSQKDGIRIALESNVQATRPLVDVSLPADMNEQIQFTNMNISISEYDSGTLRGPHTRPQGPGMQENLAIPQLDGPSTILSRNWGEWQQISE